MGKKGFLITLALIVITVIAAVFISSQGTRETQIARITQFEKSFSSEGYLIKKESVVLSGKNGYLQSIVEDGTKVSKGRAIAVVYNGKIDPNVQFELDRVNEKIEEIKAKKEELAGENLTRVDSLIADKMAELNEAASKNKLGDISKIRYEVDRLLGLKFSGEQEASVKSQELSELLSQKNALEAKLGTDKTTLYAPIAGVYSSVTDGYEETLSADAIYKLTVSYLNNIEKQNWEVMPSCKIIDNYVWYYASVISEESASGLKVGQSISLRFLEHTKETYDGAVCYVSPVEDGKVAIVISCNRYFPQLVDRREVACDIILERYTGFKVPTGALHMKDGKLGVYVKSKGMTAFREADVLYRTEEYSILKEDNTKENSLLLYDEIIIKDDEIPQ